jgi:eukaryotic-like serine/threonine-protein kinase
VTGAARAVGRYLLHEAIAAGGMATVHLGRLVGPAGFARTVAIKKLHAQFAQDPEFVTMFMDEARLAARVSHPNVVPTLDVVAVDGELLLVMAYVQGESLARLRAAMPAPERTPRDVALAIVCDALYGLHAAHEAKGEHGEPLEIVHRDVSPQNVLVGCDGVARIADFGIAKAVARATTTRDGQVKGKLSYMSPEQLSSGAMDRRADVFAAAVVLWELTTGARLFQGDGTGELVARVLSAPIPSPRALAPDTPAELEAIILKGLSRAPSERFATARGMADALETLGPARPAQVAAWVERVAGGALASRARRIEAIERAPVSEWAVTAASERATEVLEEPSSAIVAGPAPSVEAPSRARRWWGWIAAAVVAAVLTVPALRWILAPRAPVTPNAVAIPGSPVAAPPAPSSSSAPATSPAALSSAPPRVSPLAAPATPHASPPPRTKRRCDPPYYFDADGVKRFKEGCL